MIRGLCESPLTFQAITIWRDEAGDRRHLLRDVIDLETTFGETLIEEATALKKQSSMAPTLATAQRSLPSEDEEEEPKATRSATMMMTKREDDRPTCRCGDGSGAETPVLESLTSSLRLRQAHKMQEDRMSCGAERR